MLREVFSSIVKSRSGERIMQVTPGQNHTRATAAARHYALRLSASSRGMLLSIVVYAGAVSTIQEAAISSEALDLGTRKQLLFDDTLIESKHGFRTTLNPATRTDKPVLEPEMPWEKYGCTVSTVMVHNGIYKLWYRATGEDKVGRLCYATSDDGIHWSRPKLRLVSYQGSKDNNIVFEHDGTVFIDPTDTPQRRFKLIGGWGKYAYRSVNDGGARFRYSPNRPAAWHYTGVSGAYSADGIHWTKCQRNPIMPWYTDTRNVVFWDDRIQKYVVYVRWNEHLRVKDGLLRGSFDYRAIGRAESNDFENFPLPRKIMEPDFEDPADADLWGGGLYDSAAVKYPFAANAYFIFTAAFHHSSDTLDVQLATSRDGVRFNRWLVPFVRLGRVGEFDSKGIYMGVGMLPMGDEIWMYYSGYVQPHDQADREQRRPAIGRVRVRRDGFVSQDASHRGGVLTTRPVLMRGSRLEVNMDASARGLLRVEILDAAGRVVPGFGRTESDGLHGNHIRGVVTWKGNANLSSLEGRTVRLRFLGQSLRLYAFQFVD